MDNAFWFLLLPTAGSATSTVAHRVTLVGLAKCSPVEGAH